MMHKTKILSVDDEPINGLMFRSIFRNRYEVFTAESGVSGLEILKANSDIDILISDMRMPGMNGIEFTKKAKELCPDISCFILSGYDMTQEIRECINNGLIIKCFKKPIQVDEIEGSIMQELSIR